MDIYFLHEEPDVAAVAVADKHVLRSIEECAGLLCTAHRVLDGKQTGKLRFVFPKNDPRETKFYKSRLVNHAIPVWVRANAGNYFWVYRYFIVLCDRYRKQQGVISEVESSLSYVLSRYPLHIPKGRTLIPPMDEVPEEFRTEDVFESYRAWYADTQLKKDRDIKRFEETLV